VDAKMEGGKTILKSTERDAAAKVLLLNLFKYSVVFGYSLHKHSHPI